MEAPAAAASRTSRRFADLRWFQRFSGTTAGFVDGKGTAINITTLARKMRALAAPPELIRDLPEVLSGCEPIDGYVEPEVVVVQWPAGATVLLVDAPGAVGKSAAAKSLAAALNWPVVFGEKAQIGGHHLSGTIQSALGPTSTYSVEVAMGDAGVIIDSMDEALVRAGTHNLIAFLENVVQSSGHGFRSTVDAGPSVVLFSRPDTADLIQLVLEDHGLQPARVTLDFFSLVGAVAFVKAYLERRFRESGRQEYNVHRAFPGPFEKLLQARMRQISTAIGGSNDLRSSWMEVREFLGYAPVLIAIAESVAVPNPSAAIQSIDLTEHSKLLREIANYLMEREQGKFEFLTRNKLHADLPATGDEELPADMYAPPEQVQRLWADLTGVDLAVDLPAKLPISVRVPYEAAVRSFMNDHPFVRGGSPASVVFGDYLAAFMDAQGSSPAVRTASAGAPQFSLGPFYARFMATNCSDAVSVSEEVLPRILDSWWQEGDLLAAPGHAFIVISDQQVELTLDRESDVLKPMHFVVETTSGVISLPGPLKHIGIVGDGSLILGEPDTETQVGPSAFIAIRGELDLRGPVLTVRGETKALLFADTIRADKLVSVSAHGERLAVRAEPMPPALFPHRYREESALSFIATSDYVDLRSILLSFTRGMSGSPTVYYEKLSGRIVKDNKNRQKMLDHLVQMRLISPRDSNGLCTLDLSSLGDLGFSLKDIRDGEPSESVLAFLAEFRRRMSGGA